MSTVDLKDVSVNLGKAWVVDHADMEINGGELVGLIGPNGAGKSSLIRAMAGLLPYQRGLITILKQEMYAPSPVRIAKKLGYLAQSREVHWPLSVERVVALGRLPHLAPWQALSAEDELIIRQVMTRTGIEDLAGRSVHELAGGEKALVLLARVLAGTPEVILADEPVAGLDPNHQLQVMELLREEAQAGAAVLTVLHDLSLAARFCDRLYLMDQGKFAAQGTPEMVLTPDNLRRTYGIEIRTGCEPDGFYVIPWRRIEK